MNKSPTVKKLLETFKTVDISINEPEDNILAHEMDEADISSPVTTKEQNYYKSSQIPKTVYFLT